MTILKFEITGEYRQVTCKGIQEGFVMTTSVWGSSGWISPGAETTGLSYEQALWLAERFEEIDLEEVAIRKFWEVRRADFRGFYEEDHYQWLAENYICKLREQPRDYAPKDESEPGILSSWAAYIRKIINKECLLLGWSRYATKGEELLDIKCEYDAYRSRVTLYLSGRYTEDVEIYVAVKNYPPIIDSPTLSFSYVFPSENPCAETPISPKIQGEKELIDTEALERKLNRANIERSHQKTLAAYHEAQKPVTKPRHRNVEWVLSDSAALNLTKRR